MISSRHQLPPPGHTWLDNLGGSIGFALPASIGAAIGAPGRRVIALCGDGSTMYSVQGLWTMARENLDITVLVFANRTYKILINELVQASDAHLNDRTFSLLQLDNPAIGWVELSGSLGVDATRVHSCDQLKAALTLALDTQGPRLIEVVI